MAEYGGIRVVTLRVPIPPELLGGIAPDRGAIQLSLTEKYVPGAREGFIYPTANGQYVPAGRIVARNRTLQPAIIWIDVPVEVVSRLDSVYVGAHGKVRPPRPALALFNLPPP